MDAQNETGVFLGFGHLVFCGKRVCLQRKENHLHTLGISSK
jgi:hypothetical protein